MTNNKNTKKSLKFDIGTLLFRSSGGFTLFYAMLISSLLLSIGLAIFNITYKEFILTSGIRESEGAFYAADSALECALYWDFVHGGSGAPAFGFFGDSLASGLVGYWRFEESGQTIDLALDSSGQDNTGDLVGDPTRTTGQIGNSMQFDGIDDFINIPNVKGLSFGSSKEHTISLWIKVTSFPSEKQTAGVLLFGNESAGSHEWIINSDETLTVQEIGGWSLVVGALGYGWNHVVVTYDDSILTAYLNSPKTFETETTGGLFAGLIGVQPLTLGLNFLGSDLFFNGELDDVRVYSRSLSSEEVTALFAGQSNNKFVAPVNPIVDDGDIPITCSGAIINDPTTGWDVDPSDGETPIGWTITPTDPVKERQAQTVFDISFENDTCALVTVSKSVDVNDVSATTIISRGYNTCDLTNPRRLERAIRAIY